jgi:hypothetical protein
LRQKSATAASTAASRSNPLGLPALIAILCAELQYS